MIRNVCDITSVYLPKSTHIVDLAVYNIFICFSCPNQFVIYLQVSKGYQQLLYEFDGGQFIKYFPAFGHPSKIAKTLPEFSHAWDAL
jgi:hypothetical protein